MSKKTKLTIIKIFISVVIFGFIMGVIVGINHNNRDENKTEEINNTSNEVNKISNNNIIENIKESEKEMELDIRVVIDGNMVFEANLEDNQTTLSFINMLPKEFNMNELNGNEKYIYLDEELPTNSYNPKHIEAGDIMLYGNNCLVVFYKSFDTSYSYTKIGHIEKLPDLGNSNVNIKFIKNK